MIAIFNTVVANINASLSCCISDIVGRFAYKCLTWKRSGSGSEGSLLPYGRGKVRKFWNDIFFECMTRKN